MKIDKIAFSFFYAWKGIRSAWKTEQNLRIHFILTPIVVAASFLLSISIQSWTAVIFSIFLVIITELINTVIEKLCDIVESGKKGAIGTVKDISAGAVLLAAVNAVIIGVLVLGIPFFKKISALFQSSH